MINRNYRRVHTGRNAGRTPAASGARHRMWHQRSADGTRMPERIHDNVVQINSDTESHLPGCGAVMIAIRLTGKPCDFAPAAGEISYR
jgi:hypothetical protein